MSTPNVSTYPDLTQSTSDLTASLSLENPLSFQEDHTKLSELVQTISGIAGSIKEAKKYKEVKSLSEELISYVQILTDSYGNLYSEARKAEIVVLPVLTNPNQYEMDEIRVVPNDLPVIENLSKETFLLRRKLKGVMTQAKDANNPLDIKSLKESYDHLYFQYQLLSESQKNINPPLTERAQRLDEHVETTRKESANVWIAQEECEWHLERLYIYTHIQKPLESIQEDIGAIYQLNENIKKYLEQMDSKGNASYGEIDEIKIKFEKILMNERDTPIGEFKEDIQSLVNNCTEHTDEEAVNQLNQLLDCLHGNETKIADVKESIITALSNLPRSIVDEPIETFRIVVKKFNDFKSSATSFIDEVQDTINKLDASINENGNTLTDIIKEIPLYNSDVRKGVNTHLMQTVADMKAEKNEMKTKIENSWDQINQDLSHREKGRLFNEIYRVGYWLLDNHGKKPRDMTSNWIGFGWTPSFDYVTPFNQTITNE